ncbi:hypothetical protein M8J76_008611 [Diaphorina citri]|nr:hypothetical protein M8J76_008611 [Diaphorina citri]KAI5752071.1 hypothetical protein M8J77_013540 [Diaphorina citri]
MNSTLETIQNLAGKDSFGMIKWLQKEMENVTMKVTKQFTDGNCWLCKQNPVLIGTTVVCASILAVLLEYLRKKKSIQKYEILLATVVRPNSTPEDVAVNCTFGALSVGMKTNLNNPEILDMWKKSGSEKKVIAVDDELVLHEMQRMADEKNIVNVLVKDVPTSTHANTTLAIGPALPRDLLAFANFGRVIGQSKISM